MTLPLLLLALLASVAAGAHAQSCAVDGPSRTDCGYVGVTQPECEAKGCCWSPIEDGSGNYPWCFYKDARSCGGYIVTSEQTTPLGVDLELSMPTGQGCQLYGEDVQSLLVRVEFETEHRLHVKISDLVTQRYEVPEQIFPRPTVGSRPAMPAYTFTYTTAPFGFAVARRSTGEVIFNTTGADDFANLIFEDQYLELSTVLPTNANIYGLGERVRPLRLAQNIPYTMWSADEATPVNQNIYGVHPFYMEVRGSGNTHGVLLMNSNGMDVTLKANALTYQVIGGVLDFYFFEGPSPAQVLDQYTELVGRPYLMPFWSLGFHQCRYGYKNIAEVKEVVRRYREADIPLEAMWIDIDYMDAYMDWTFDPVNYPVSEVAAFVDELHANNQRNVLIVDPAIKNLTGYKYYDDGLVRDVFIKDGTTHEPMIGMVWPHYTVFPDFLNPETENYWTDSLADFRSLVEVDGLWIDMNEPASFCQGNKLWTCSYPEMRRRHASSGLAFDDASHTDVLNRESKAFQGMFDPLSPPFRINNGNSRKDLDVKTTAMDAYHHDGSIEYNVHNLYGISEAIHTFNAISKVIGKRPFVLSRSTFPGSGRVGGHWTGDNFATWDHLYYSIPGMLQFQLFGITYVGADICGFISDTTEELCARWMQLGSFYTFSRNHNTISARSQEPYLWESVAKNSRTSLAIRYSLLNYYYTLLYQASQNGAAVIRPLFYEHPSDSTTFAIDRQFYVGASILVTPVLSQGATSVTGYLPAGEWYDWYTLTKIAHLVVGEYRDFTAPLDYIPIHIRGGGIIPTQSPGYTTTETRSNPFELIVALNSDLTASGFLYADDGDSIDTPDSATTKITYTAGNNQLKATGTYGFSIQPTLHTIKIVGIATTRPTSVTINGAVFPVTYESWGFSVHNLDVSMNADFTLVW